MFFGDIFQLLDRDETGRSEYGISNENIAVANTLKRDNKTSFLWVYAKKPGKTKLSFTYKGKKYSINVVTRKWASPVKKLTINKKDVASKYKNRSRYETAIAGKKVTVTPAKGWKLTSLRCGANYTINDFTNGTRVPKPSGTDAWNIIQSSDSLFDHFSGLRFHHVEPVIQVIRYSRLRHACVFCHI